MLRTQELQSIAMRCLLLIYLGLVGCSRKETLQHPATPAESEPLATNVDPARRPFASRQETTITLQSSEASFTIPQSWLEWHQEFGNNLHLTHAQLDAVAQGDGEWDTEYANVCNAVLPLERCCAHVGSEGWARQAVSYGDLQVRVYDLANTPEEIEHRINAEGVAEIRRFSGKDPELTQDLEAKWRRTMLLYERFYQDYGATAHVDFRAGRFDDRTFVLVFMYTSYESQEKVIASILDSFKAR